MRENTGTFIGLGAFVLIILLISMIGGGSFGGRLDASTIGTNGLMAWLRDDGYDTARANRRTSVTESEVALRILPLYDSDIFGEDPEPKTPEDLRAQETLRDINGAILIQKIRRVETLLVLSKWRNGVFELDLLDPQLRVGSARLNNVLDDLGYPQLQLIRPETILLEEPNGITLYAPQLFDPDRISGSCKPYVSTSAGVLVAKCTGNSSQDLFVLSDPDLLNNHGLSLGANATAARDLISGIVRGRPGIIYQDFSDSLTLKSDRASEEPPEPRSAEELSRLLTYPFNVIWMGFGLAFLIALWRGMVRFGPALRSQDYNVGASKTVSIRAKATLLRLAGKDHALVEAFVKNKLDELSRAVLGKQVNKNQLFSKLVVLAPAQANDLKMAVNALEDTNTGTSAQNLAALTHSFEDAYRRLHDELGHVPRRR